MIANRILLLIEYFNLTPGEFADILEIQRSSVSHLTSGRNKPSIDFLDKLNKKFPSINIEWVISGKGYMIKPDKSFITSNIPPTTSIIKEDPLLLFSDENNLSTTTLDKNNIATEEDKEIIPKLESINVEKKVKQIIVVYENNSFEILTPRESSK